jgi:hypothetical protein
MPELDHSLPEFRHQQDHPVTIRQYDAQVHQVLQTGVLVRLQLLNQEMSDGKTPNVWKNVIPIVTTMLNQT